MDRTEGYLLHAGLLLYGYEPCNVQCPSYTVLCAWLVSVYETNQGLVPLEKVNLRNPVSERARCFCGTEIILRWCKKVRGLHISRS